MAKKWFLVGGILLLVSLLVVGCGVPQEQYDALSSDLSKAQQELQSIKAELGSAQAKVSELTSSLRKAETDLEATQTDLEATQTDLKATQTDLGATQTDLGAVSKELAEIKNVYPPRDFSSRSELVDWLQANDVSEGPTAANAENLYSKALEIQEDALKDGYIISVDVDELGQSMFGIACVAIIDGDIWAWGPEGDEPVQYMALGKVGR